MAGRLGRGTVAAAFFAGLFLLIQLVLPAAALFGNRPGRLGWQMYSALPRLPVAWTVSFDGSFAQVELRDLFALERSEIDYRAVLLGNLCSVTAAAAVRVAGDERHAPKTIKCH